MKPKHFEREVRRSRHLLASINVEGRAHCECQVLDISTHGAKVVAATPSAVPDRSELAFFEGVQSRVCEVVWATRQDAWRQVHLLNGATKVTAKTGAGSITQVARDIIWALRFCGSIYGIFQKSSDVIA